LEFEIRTLCEGPDFELTRGQKNKFILGIEPRSSSGVITVSKRQTLNSFLFFPNSKRLQLRLLNDAIVFGPLCQLLWEVDCSSSKFYLYAGFWSVYVCVLFHHNERRW